MAEAETATIRARVPAISVIRSAPARGIDILHLFSRWGVAYLFDNAESTQLPGLSYGQSEKGMLVPRDCFRASIRWLRKLNGLQFMA